VKKILVTGATGQLGAAIVHEFRRDADVIALGHADCDLADHDRVMATVADARPDVVINCAGDNAVDAAETRPERALAVNAFGVRSLVYAAGAVGATLVHYSSDFVFDGTGDRPYTEEDRANPQSVYASSKLLGDLFVLDHRSCVGTGPVAGSPKPAFSYLLRVESLFGHVPGEGRPPKGSVAAILDGLVSGREVRVFTDRTVSPTYVIDAALATRQVIECGLPSGLYHCVNSGFCTWWEFAEEAARQLEVEPQLAPITLEQVSLRAPRPKFCAMDNGKLRDAGVEMPDWRDALARYLARRDEFSLRVGAGQRAGP
jgi:dTDP-4-dehydrorhamnose reductase